MYLYLAHVGVLCTNLNSFFSMEYYNPRNGDDACFLCCLALPGVKFTRFFLYFGDDWSMSY
jgi:hypothetical protein